MPDGTGADQQDTDPGTPEEQINNTVATTTLFDTISRTMSPVFGLLGIGNLPTPQTGGGGGGGAYMFASLEELDGVIQQWQDLVDDIKEDQGNIESAAHQTASPAGDPVSGSNFRQSTDVVQAMRKHNETLLVYAEHYVVKLKECRSQMATTEDGTETSMNQVH